MSALWKKWIPLNHGTTVLLSAAINYPRKLASIPGHHTNYSLRATGATQLYTAGVPEKIIQERTGHHSVECLRSYECASDKQQHAVSRILSSNTQLNFQTEMKKLEMHGTIDTHGTLKKGQTQTDTQSHSLSQALERQSNF